MDVEAAVDGKLSSMLVSAGTADVPVNIVIGTIALDGEETRAVPSSQEMASPIASGPAGRLFASPIARRLIAAAGLDAKSLTGSGPHGRIVERDVKAAIAARETSASPAPEAASSKPSSATQPATSDPAAAREDLRKLYQPGTFDEVPHDAMRLTIARRLLESKQTVPHFYVAADCRIDALLALRAQLNGGNTAAKLSINDFVVKAMAIALRQVPDANVTFCDDVMLRHHQVDIGVAVAIPGGLFTPIVRNADTKTITAISATIRELTDRAKSRKLRPEEYTGGAASVSNLGMYGVQDFTAIINPPQSTILAVGAAERRLILDDDGGSHVASIMRVTLSADHRAVDGATAAQLIGTFRQLVQSPMTMLV
jgi:pyruvate dehydrogenase E2 component (dihydrolipoamide acetyltransferase)